MMRKPYMYVRGPTSVWVIRTFQMDDGTPTIWVIGMPIIHECRIFDDENALYEGEENTFMWVMGTLSIWSS